jgi:hypothetical protein
LVPRKISLNAMFTHLKQAFPQNIFIQGPHFDINLRVLENDIPKLSSAAFDGITIQTP